MISPFRFLLMTAATITLVGCSGSDDEDRLAGELAPPERVDVLSPPVAPDPTQMHPALQIARSRGMKTNVYFNEELQQAVARLNGMEETLGRLQGDLQGTAMAMQRVEMMRQEIDALNVRFQSLQERLMYAGPILAPAAAQAEPIAAQTTVETTTVSEQGPTAMTVEQHAGPTPLMGDMAKPEEASKSVQMKPVMDEKAAAKKPAAEAPKAVTAGGNNVRIGTHADSVRIVLDVAEGSPKFTTNLDTAEKILTVDVPEAKFNGTGQIANPLITSWAAQDSGKGSVIAFSLKGDTKILKTSTLKNPDRIVIDLAK